MADAAGWLDSVDPGIDSYLEGLLPERHPAILEMEGYAREQGFPYVGPQVGALLELLARSIGAGRVFELGSGFGYSAAWFLRGMGQDAELVCTDLNEDNRDRALASFQQMGRAEALDFRLGDALELLEQADGPFDILFCDIDKQQYPAVIEPAFAKLRPGGLLIVDNALWYGKVADEGSSDEATEGVREFNRRLAEHPGFASSILPLRDGVAVAIRLETR